MSVNLSATQTYTHLKTTSDYRMTIDWPKFVEVIQSASSFLLTSHIRPDCDALGSELAMAGVLESLGKKVRIVNGHPVPPNLAFIDPDKKIEVVGEDVQVEDLRDGFDVMMILDTSAWAQLGAMGDVVKTINAQKIILDHHVSSDELGATPFKNTSAEAAGRLVIEAAGHLGVKLTPAIAKAAFAAIATDTGWFRFPSASPGTYRMVADLIEAGASPPDIYGDLYECDSIGRVRLRGAILARVESDLDGRLMHTYVLKEDFEKTGALPSDTEDVINMTLAIEGAEGAAIFVEQVGGGFKLSFRSRCQMDCSQVAEQFGGGGHKAAAGAFMEGSLADVQAPVLEAVKKAMTA